MKMKKFIHDKMRKEKARGCILGLVSWIEIIMIDNCKFLLI